MTTRVGLPAARLSRMTGYVALYPAVALALITLHIWTVSGVSPFAAVRGLAVAFAIAIIPVGLGGILLRDRDRGGVLGMLIVLGLAAGARQPIALLPLVGGALLLLERYGPWHVALDWAWIGRTLRRATAILALAVFLEALQLGRLGDLATALANETPLRSAATAAAPAGARDVYLLVLDGYARHDILQERFGLDDSAFLSGLRDRGFAVATANHSNYMATLPSISSFLNYRHLADVPALRPLLENPAGDAGPAVHRAITGAAVLDQFRQLGYETIAVGSGFEQSAVRSADSFVDRGQLNDFEIHLLRPSVVSTLLMAFDPDTFSRSQRERIESVLGSVEQLAAGAASRPRFVFAHVPSPHRPWVNMADGSPRVATDLETWYFDTPETTGMSREEIVAGFTGQTSYIGRRALVTIDAILAGSSQPPIILVVSDHGPSLDVATGNVETRLRNLFAAYTPGKDALFPDDVTLVNVFPTIFGAYYGVELPRAAETIYGPGPGGVFDPVPLAP